MIQSLNQLSILASVLLQEEHPPAGAANPFDFGLSPFWTIVIVLLVILLIWVAIRIQSGRGDLHTAAQHDDGHAHEELHQTAKVQTVPYPVEPAIESVEAIEEPAPEPEAETVPLPTPASSAGMPDNLRKIEGIGPKVASVLNEAGISTFAQLAAAEITRLQEALDAAGYQYMNPASWPVQAKLAAAGDWNGLEKLQDELKGGK